MEDMPMKLLYPTMLSLPSVRADGRVVLCDIHTDSIILAIAEEIGTYPFAESSEEIITQNIDH